MRQSTHRRRHFPDNPQIQGNRTIVPPPRELHPSAAIRWPDFGRPSSQRTTAYDAVDGSSTGIAMCQIAVAFTKPLMSASVQVSRTPFRCAYAVRVVCRRPRSAKARNRGGGAQRVQAVLWGIGPAGTGAWECRAAATDGDDAVARRS